MACKCITLLHFDSEPATMVASSGVLCCTGSWRLAQFWVTWSAHCALVCVNDTVYMNGFNRMLGGG